MKKKTRKIIIVTALILIVAVFAVVSVLWCVFYNNNIKPMLSNSKLCLSDEMNGTKNYHYSDSENGIMYDVFVHGFLDFGGNLQVTNVRRTYKGGVFSDIITKGSNRYYMDFLFIPKLFDDGVFWFSVHFDNVEVAYSVYTDSELKLIDEDIEGTYLEMKEEISEIYQIAIDFWGEDVLD